MRTTARMTALRPGQSPPPLRTPTRTGRTYCRSAASACLRSDIRCGRRRHGRLRRQLRDLTHPRAHAHDLLEPAAARRVGSHGAGGGGGGEPRPERGRLARRAPARAARPARLHPRRAAGCGSRRSSAPTPSGRPTTPPPSPTSVTSTTAPPPVSLPITNEKGILQVSPGDGLASLTTVPPGKPQAGPARYYPTDARSFLRLAPSDLTLGERLLARARAAGAPAARGGLRRSHLRPRAGLRAGRPGAPRRSRARRGQGAERRPVRRSGAGAGHGGRPPRRDRLRRGRRAAHGPAARRALARPAADSRLRLGGGPGAARADPHGPGSRRGGVHRPAGGRAVPGRPARPGSHRPPGRDRPRQRRGARRLRGDAARAGGGRPTPGPAAAGSSGPGCGAARTRPSFPATASTSTGCGPAASPSSGSCGDEPPSRPRLRPGGDGRDHVGAQRRDGA